MPTWLPTESEAPSINPKCVRFSFAFPRRLASVLLPWRFTFPGDSSVLANTTGGSRFLANPPSHVLAGRGLVVLQLNGDTINLQKSVGSWLLLVPSHRLVYETR